MSDAPFGPTAPLRIARHGGRLRAWRHVALLPLLVGGAGFWLGLAGSVPMLVWWWLRRPVPGADGGAWIVDPTAVRGYRFGRFRTWIELAPEPSQSRCRALTRWRRPGRNLEIFHDELAPSDLARLRRLVKAGAAH